MNERVRERVTFRTGEAGVPRRESRSTMAGARQGGAP
jgi:hypothetical protein